MKTFDIIAFCTIAMLSSWLTVYIITHRQKPVEVGSEWIWTTDKGNPFEEKQHHLRILEVKNGFAKYYDKEFDMTFSMEISYIQDWCERVEK